MQGGLYNTVLRVMQRIGLADTFGNSRIPIYCMNVTYPQVPRRDHLVLCRQARRADDGGGASRLHRAGAQHYFAPRRHQHQGLWQGRAADGRRIHRRRGDEGPRRVPRQDAAGVASMRSSRTPRRRPSASLATRRPRRNGRHVDSPAATRPSAPAARSGRCSLRLNSPSARSARRTCPATSAATASACMRRSISATLAWATASASRVRGHRARTSASAPSRSWAMAASGITASRPASRRATYNNADSVLIVMKNGYTSATGWQFLPSSTQSRDGLVAQDQSVENALRGVGMKWMRTVNNYKVGEGREGAARGADHGGEGPQGHHRRGRVHAGEAAPRARGGREEHRRRHAVSRSRNSASTIRSAPAITPASACRAARR